MKTTELRTMHSHTHICTSQTSDNNTKQYILCRGISASSTQKVNCI